MSTTVTGIVKWFNPAKGFGFIDYEGVDYFVHFGSINMEGYKTLEQGQPVQFKANVAERGPVAEDVYLAEA
jgi:cold shock protein